MMRQEAGFDPEMAGKPAECDGGGAIGGTRYAGRQEFTGRLTGDYVDHGDPPWRWYLMTDLTQKPENYPDDAVWCESGNLWLVDESKSQIGIRGHVAEMGLHAQSSPATLGYRGRSPLTGGSGGVPPTFPQPWGGVGWRVPPTPKKRAR